MTIVLTTILVLASFLISVNWTAQLAIMTIALLIMAAAHDITQTMIKIHNSNITFLNRRLK